MFETLKGRIPKSIDEDEYRKFAVMAGTSAAGMETTLGTAALGS